MPNYTASHWVTSPGVNQSVYIITRGPSATPKVPSTASLMMQKPSVCFHGHVCVFWITVCQLTPVFETTMMVATVHYLSAQFQFDSCRQLVAV